MADEVNPQAIVRADEFDPKRMIHTGNGTRLKGRLAGGVRDKITMAQMKARIAALWASADENTYEEIAEKVSDEFHLEGDQRLKKDSIHFHIKSLINYWKEQALLSVDEKMARVQARYAQLEAIAEQALFASMEGKEVTSYKKQMERARSKDREKWIAEQVEYERTEAEKNGEKPKLFTTEHIDEALITTSERTESLRRVELTAGDPRWFAHLVDINNKRAELWNLKNHAAVANPDQEAARLSDDERDQRLTAVITRALERKALLSDNLADPSPLGGNGHKNFSEEDVEGLEF